jgi:hypothetical protein
MSSLSLKKIFATISAVTADRRKLPVLTMGYRYGTLPQSSFLCAALSSFENTALPSSSLKEHWISFCVESAVVEVMELS